MRMEKLYCNAPSRGCLPSTVHHPHPAASNLLLDRELRSRQRSANCRTWFEILIRDKLEVMHEANRAELVNGRDHCAATRACPSVSRLSGRLRHTLSPSLGGLCQRQVNPLR